MNSMNANQSPGQNTGGGQPQQNPTSRDRSILNGGNAQSGAGGVLNLTQQVDPRLDPRLGGYGGAYGNQSPAFSPASPGFVGFSPTSPSLTQSNSYSPGPGAHGGYNHDGGDLGGTSTSRKRAAGARSPLGPAGVHTALPVGKDFQGYMQWDHDEIAIEEKRLLKIARLANRALGLGQASISRNNSGNNAGNHLIDSVSPVIPLGPGTDPPAAPDMRL